MLYQFTKSITVPLHSTITINNQIIMNRLAYIATIVAVIFACTANAFVPSTPISVLKKTSSMTTVVNMGFYPSIEFLTQTCSYKYDVSEIFRRAPFSIGRIVPTHLSEPSASCPLSLPTTIQSNDPSTANTDI